MLKGKYSLIAFLIVAITFIVFRFEYIKNNDKNGYNATSWDAFGYYMYLPSIFIYDDVKELKWVEHIDSTYHVTGGQFYQAIQLENGNYTNKYLCGVSITQIPFFIIGHISAKILDYPQDGFSTPYQYSIMFGGIIWVLIGLIILIKVLKHYFKDDIIALTILFLGLTSNLIQYTSVDGAMSHSHIFPLYAIVLWLTIKWHENPTWLKALLIGATIGLATISRPTELIMLFIPLLWNTSQNDTRKMKWQLVAQRKMDLFWCVFGGLLAMLPQFIYWKYTTDSYIFNVGSKWFFLNPWFRVLFGPEKGWFLYTPVAIMMIIGLFLMKGQPYKRSIVTFCILNIWIIMAWSDWKYGASYSTRALIQSYPVLAFGLAHFIAKTWNRNYILKLALIATLMLLSLINFYQLNIYNMGVLERFSVFLPPI